MASLAEFSRAGLAQIDEAGRRRTRRCIEAWRGTESVALVDGVERIVFCSNDYLGLARDPRLVAAFVEAARAQGAGSGASHLVCGHSREHHALEEELAAFTGRERALLFSTGYLANLGVIGALLGRDDRIVADRLNHASLVDAAVLSRAELVRYAHGSVAAMAERLAAPARGHTLIATDGVFSMDGDIAPLPALAQSARAHDAWLMVDDAHGLGVLGASGRGSLEAAALAPAQVPILMGTLGKAFGTQGAFVAGDQHLIELLVQTARPYIYTTALPPAIAAATRVAVALAAGAEAEREHLRAQIRLFRHEVGVIGLKLLESETPIQPIVFGSGHSALAASEFLWDRGLWVGAIRPPTVPEGTARLRITLTANQTRQQVLQLIEALAQLAKASADGRSTMTDVSP